jgi:hypothetical protein
MIWYALLCVTDQFDKDGKLEYPAGAIKSYGTVLPGTPAELAAKGLEAIPIGDYGEAGPDFNKERFDTVRKRMVPYTPPKDEADALLDKSTWGSGDTEKALRLLLSRLKR